MIIRWLFSLPQIQVPLFLTPTRGHVVAVSGSGTLKSGGGDHSHKEKAESAAASASPLLSGRTPGPNLFKWAALETYTVDGSNCCAQLNCPGCCLSARRGRARAPTGKAGEFLWPSYIFLCSERPGILFFTLALEMGYQSRVLTAHDLDLIICWKQRKIINQPLILKNGLWFQPVKHVQSVMLAL